MKPEKSWRGKRSKICVQLTRTLTLTLTLAWPLLHHHHASWVICGSVEGELRVSVARLTLVLAYSVFDDEAASSHRLPLIP